jgi:large subunit ribosomal protein L25
MKSITIKGSKRESVGKVATKALRNAEKVPCVLYGGDKVIHFSTEEKSFKDLVYTPNVYTATIDVDGHKYPAIMQDLQLHPVTDHILHVDFYQLFDDKMVILNIPVRLEGTSPGVLNGGSFRFPMRKLAVKAFPKDLPDFITADISKLKIGSKLYVTQLGGENYTILHPDNTVVVQVRTSRKATAEVEGEEEENAVEEAPGATE